MSGSGVSDDTMEGAWFIQRPDGIIIQGCWSAVHLDRRSIKAPEVELEDPTLEPPCIRVIDDNYILEHILPSPLGLPSQLALLPDGDIAIGDPSHDCIHILSDGAIHTVVTEDLINAWAVAALPDGRLCYSKKNGQLILVDPVSGVKEFLATTPCGDYASVLAADEDGNIYVATDKRNLYQFTLGGDQIMLATDLPYDEPGGKTITDMGVATDGTVYVAGYNLFVAVSPDGTVTAITDQLHSEPTWCAVDPDGKVYIKDIFHGVQQYDSATGELTPIQIWADTGVSDFLALNNDDFIFCSGSELIYTYNLTTHTPTPIFVNAVNSFAFAVNANNTAFLATPSLGNLIVGAVLQSHIISLLSDGTTQDLTDLPYYNWIQAADVDWSNRLCLFTSEGFYRLEPDGSITAFTLESSVPPAHNFAVGPDGRWYCIASDFDNSIQVYCFDEEGSVTFPLITFTRDDFSDDDDVLRVDDARIDVGADGRLALIVTAVGSMGQGPYYQRVYRADADGTSLTLIANLDSERIAGMVDIAVGPNNSEVFVLTVQKIDGVFFDPIYRVDENGTVSEFIRICAGRDPKSIDVDPAGNVWFSTMLGVFRAASHL